MKRLLVSVVFALVFCPSMSWGQQNDFKRSYFAQIVLGDGWKVVFDCLNMTAENHSVSIKLHLTSPGEYFISEEDGRIPSFSYSASLGSEEILIEYSMTPKGYRFNSVEKTNPGMNVGWAELIQDNTVQDNIACTATLQLFNEGKMVTEAGVKPSSFAPEHLLTVFAAKVDKQLTGLAIANPNPEEVDVVMEMIKPGSGLHKLQWTETLARNGHIARYWTLFFPQYASDPLWLEKAAIAGVLSVRGFKKSDGSPAPIVVLTLRTREIEDNYPKGYRISPVTGAQR